MKTLNVKMGTEKKHIKLNELGREQPFKVPNDYFENFEHQLFSKIEALESGKKSKGIILYLKPFLTVAASIAVALLLIYYPIKSTNVKTSAIGNNADYTESEYMANYFATDREIFECIETSVQKDQIDNTVIESVLLASLTDIELMELN